MILSQDTVGSDIAHAIARLVSAESRDGGWDIKTPLLYPSGAAVTINAVPIVKDSYRISDIGLGFQEAYLMDSGTGFARAAHILAEEAGLNYEKKRIYVSDVSLANLPAAIRLVANCSQTAVIQVLDRVKEAKARERGDALYSMLRHIFPDVAQRAQLPGASSTAWTVDALVRMSGGRLAAFDAVANHQTSVAATSMKFRDIALREDNPKRCAVVESKKSFGTLLAVLSQAGSVIEDKSPDETVREMAEAA